MKMTKKEFTDLYHSMTNAEICEHFGIHQSTLYRYLKKYNIPMKGQENAYKYRKNQRKKVDIV